MAYNWFEHDDREQDIQKSLQLNWIEHLPFPAIITDKYWNILQINPPFTTITGFTFHTLPDKNITAIINPDHIIPVDPVFGADHGICQLLCHDGTKLDCNISRKIFLAEKDISLRLITITPVDFKLSRSTPGLSASSKRESITTGPLPSPSADVQRTQMQLKELLNQTSTGIWEVVFSDGQEITRAMNFFELLNLPLPSGPLNPSLFDHSPLVYIEDLPVYSLISKQLKTGSPAFCAIDYRINDPKGRTRYIHAESKISRDENNNLRLWSGSIQDHTHKQRAAILQESAFNIARFIHPQQTIDGLIDALKKILGALMPIPDFSVALINKEGALHYQFPEQLLKTKPVHGLPAYVVKTGEPLLVSQEGIKLMIDEGIIVLQEIIPYSYLGMPLIAGDKCIGIISLQSFSPKTIYTEDESNLLHFISLQAALAIQHILNEGALLKSKNEAEDSSRLKSSLLANMSHELRTPMTGILGFSEILFEELEDPRMKSMASTIFKSAGRLMSTLNSIIDLSAIEADKNSLNMKPIDTRQLFQPLLRVAHSIASDKGLYLRTSIPPEQYVLSDEKMLSQLLYHLLDNALKFTVDGGVSVSVYKPSKTSNEIVIRISDTGIGIAPEHHSFIFEEFRQVSEGFSRTFEGSGLGLSLCSKISRLINARIWVESIQEKGSDFFVALPLSEPLVNIKDIDEATAQKIRTSRLSRGPVPEVLIVEDNEINRRLAALYLREICNTEMAENGYVAREKISRKRYDAILMDINLGAGPNGLSIAGETRKTGLNRYTPIIAVTGYTMHGDREKLLDNGCTHYIPKPYDKKTLLKLFTEILYA